MGRRFAQGVSYLARSVRRRATTAGRVWQKHSGVATRRWPSGCGPWRASNWSQFVPGVCPSWTAKEDYPTLRQLAAICEHEGHGRHVAEARSSSLGKRLGKSSPLTLLKQGSSRWSRVTLQRVSASVAPSGRA